jgi:hypothetical protein
MTSRKRDPSDQQANPTASAPQPLHHRILRYRLARTAVVVAAGVTLRISWRHLFPEGVPGLRAGSAYLLPVIALCLSIGLSTALRRRYHRPHH